MAGPAFAASDHRHTRHREDRPAGTAQKRMVPKAVREGVLNPRIVPCAGMPLVPTERHLVLTFAGGWQPKELGPRPGHASNWLHP